MAQADGGDILCGGDVCIQDFMGDTSQTVNTWAATKSCTGHFEDSFGCGISSQPGRSALSILPTRCTTWPSFPHVSTDT